MDEILIVKVNPHARKKEVAEVYLKEIEEKVKDLDLKCKTLVTFDDVDVYTTGGGFLTATACSCVEKSEDAAE